MTYNNQALLAVRRMLRSRVDLRRLPPLVGLANILGHVSILDPALAVLVCATAVSMCTHKRARARAHTVSYTHTPLRGGIESMCWVFGD